MKIYDLTQLIETDMTVFKGTPPPAIEAVANCEQDGYKESRLVLFSHMGTHIDSQQHVFKNGKSLEKYSPDNFLGTAFVIDCRKRDTISMSALTPFLDKIIKADFLLFCTGWDRFWKSSKYYNFPLFSHDAVEFLQNGRYKGIGVDMISVDAIDSTSLPVHKSLLKKDDFIIIENLCNMEKIVGSFGELTALPLKFASSDGAMARVIFKGE
jgi:kynurenine formamidase